MVSPLVSPKLSQRSAGPGRARPPSVRTVTRRKLSVPDNVPSVLPQSSDTRESGRRGQHAVCLRAGARTTSSPQAYSEQGRGAQANLSSDPRSCRSSFTGFTLHALNSEMCQTVPLKDCQTAPTCL